MKDQNSIDYEETQEEKWNRAVDLFMESVHKPDASLRQAAHDQKCFTELMEIREVVLKYLYTLRKYK